MNSSSVIVSNLMRTFGKTCAVNNISLEVKRGELFGVIGPDGAGKSTLLRLLVGVLKNDSGNVLIDGIDVYKNPEAAHLKVGYMPQRFSVYQDLSVDENMEFFADLYGIRGPEFLKRREELLKFSRLYDHRKTLGGALSGGMQKKLALSCTLFHKPALLLLDEPTNGVDPVSRRELWGLLYELIANGTTIIVSTSYMDEAERCGRVALLYNGEILLCDEPSKLINKFSDIKEKSFEKVFICLIEKKKNVNSSLC